MQVTTSTNLNLWDNDYYVICPNIHISRLYVILYVLRRQSLARALVPVLHKKMNLDHISNSDCMLVIPSYLSLARDIAALLFKVL
jgi:hypothetical protein